MMNQFVTEPSNKIYRAFFLSFLSLLNRWDIDEFLQLKKIPPPPFVHKNKTGYKMRKLSA